MHINEILYYFYMYKIYSECMLFFNLQSPPKNSMLNDLQRADPNKLYFLV